MKKIKCILTGLFILFLSAGIMAQAGPPNPPGNHGVTGDEQPGGDAPIGAGIFILLGLGAAYGGKKVYNLKKKEGE